MAKCKNCKHLGYLFDGDQVGERVWCENITDNPDLDMERDCDHYVPMTNADRIRSMTDEELAFAVMCPAEIDFGYEKCIYAGNCERCTLEWLQKESEDHK